MVDYGVTGYAVRVGRVKGAWAQCDYRNRELVFDPVLLWCDWVFINQVVLHEVAHVIAGSRSGHNSKWLNTARAMGYRLGPVVPYRDRVIGVHRWVATCATGEHSAIRYERNEDADVVVLCGKCSESGAGDVEVSWERL